MCSNPIQPLLIETQDDEQQDPEDNEPALEVPSQPHPTAHAGPALKETVQISADMGGSNQLDSPSSSSSLKSAAESCRSPGSPIPSESCRSPGSPIPSESTRSPDSPIPSDLTFSESASSTDIEAILGPEKPPGSPVLKTYKLVGDNIDKNVRPREMTSDNQTRSLHYFHTYALRDRVDLSTYSNEVRMPVLDSVQLDNFLPTSTDEKVIMNNFGVLVGRILMKNIPFLQQFGKGLEKHILHEYTEEMASKSDVVS